MAKTRQEMLNQIKRIMGGLENRKADMDFGVSDLPGRGNFRKAAAEKFRDVQDIADSRLGDMYLEKEYWATHPNRYKTWSNRDNAIKSRQDFDSACRQMKKAGLVDSDCRPVDNPFGNPDIPAVTPWGWGRK